MKRYEPDPQNDMKTIWNDMPRSPKTIWKTIWNDMLRTLKTIWKRYETICRILAKRYENDMKTTSRKFVKRYENDMKTIWLDRATDSKLQHVTRDTQAEKSRAMGNPELQSATQNTRILAIPQRPTGTRNTQAKFCTFRNLAYRWNSGATWRTHAYAFLIQNSSASRIYVFLMRWRWSRNDFINNVSRQFCFLRFDFVCFSRCPQSKMKELHKQRVFGTVLTAIFISFV